MKKTTVHFYSKLIIAALCVLVATANTFGQCPTIDQPIQSFCDVETPTVANLTAIDNGGGIRWYISATATTPLANSVGLIHNNTYYVDDQTGNCGTRSAVTVTIYGPPSTVNFQGFCVNAPEEVTVSSLVANGHDVQWYDVPSGGTPLAGTTILTNQTYYVDQANPATGCRTSRRAVVVSIGGVVPAPTGNSIQAFCEGDNPTVADLQASGTNRWYSTESSGNPLDPSTPLVDGASYYATTYNFPCESDERLQITVEIQQPNDAGLNGEIEICESGLGSSHNINLFDALLGTPDTTGSWSGPIATSNGATGSLDVASLTASASPYVFTYSVSSEGCPTSTATVTLIITESANPGTNSTLNLCNNSTALDLFDSLGGTPEPGGVWSPALASGTGVFDPLVDAPGVYTYTVQGVPPCGTASATVTVTIHPEVDAGTDGSITLCIDNAPIDLFDSLGGTPETGGTWSPALTSGTGVFDPLVDSAGTYLYTVSGIAPCADATATITVSVQTGSQAGLDGQLTVCTNDTPQDLFDSLGGTPELGGVWSPALASGSGVFDPLIDAPGIYTYTVQGVPPCGAASATVTVMMLPEVDAGTDGSATLCYDSAPINLFDSLGGTPETGGTWSPALTSGTGIFDPLVDTAGTYLYTVSGTSPCADATAAVTVTVETDSQAGIDGQLTICVNDAPQNLFDSLGGTPDSGGVWTPALNSGTGIFDPILDPEGVYTYTTTNSCGSDSATVTVTRIPQPDITGLRLGADDICLEDSLIIEITGAVQLTDGPYTIDYQLSGANTLNQTASVTFANGDAQLFITADQLTVPGITTFTVLDLIDPVTGCGLSTPTPLELAINVNYADTPQLIPDGNLFCEADHPTITELTNNLMEAHIITWYDAPENGSPYTPDTPLVDGMTYYASNTTIEGCGNELRLAVTVSIESCEPLEIIIPDGFSPNGDMINDEFEIKNLRELYPNFKLQIYNRYGNILYKGDTNTPNWNGTSNQGRALGSGVLPVGVYYYILELKDATNKTIQGRLYLNR